MTQDIINALIVEGRTAAEHAAGHHIIDIGDAEHSVAACVECDEEICPECQSNLVDLGDALICIGCGLTAA